MNSFIGANLLTTMIWLPAAGAAAVVAVPARREALVPWMAFGTAAAVFLLSLGLYAGFDPAGPGMQFTADAVWLPAWGMRYTLGADGISMPLLALTALLVPLAVLASFGHIRERVKAFYASMLVLETAMLGVFAAQDVFLFYVFWEAMLIPMYFLIGVWGGPRRIYAALKFFVYTMLGSVLMLGAIIYLVLAYKAQSGVLSFALADLRSTVLAPGVQPWLFAAFALAFAVKVPLFPLHTWLPDAHVEAPTGVSVLLAGVLLKMGVYGYLRFAMPLFPQAAVSFAPWLAAAGAVGVVYGSLTAWSQYDIKKIIAYSSVAHLGLIVLAVSSFEPAAVSGAVLQMISHGLSTGALFLGVGILYERRHTRLLDDFGGLAGVMPRLSAVFMIVTLSSIGLPGLNGFAGEFLMLFGSFRAYPLLAGLAVSGVILSAVYMLEMYQRVFFGPVTQAGNRLLPDMTAREWACLLPPLFLIVYLGVHPGPFLRKTDAAVKAYISSVRPAGAGEAR